MPGARWFAPRVTRGTSAAVDLSSLGDPGDDHELLLVIDRVEFLPGPGTRILGGNDPGTGVLSVTRSRHY